MSLIHTCQLCAANSFDYLTELQRHARELAADFIAEFKMAVDPLSLPIPAFRGLPVMLMNGDEISRELLKQLLAGWGAELVEARNTSEALHELSEARGAGRQFSLFLINADLPDTSELARHLRARGEGSIVFLASLKTAAISRALDGHLVQAIVMKPVLPETLSRAMVTALRPAAPAVQRQSSSAVTNSVSHHVLLAEDNKINQVVAQRLLERAGCIVAVVDNGRAALEQCFENPYDAIFMDVQMPEMDGWEATRAIRARELGAAPNADGHRPHIPIIAMTAHALTGDRERCLAAGMDAYVSKPIDPDALIAVLAEVRLLQAEAAGAVFEVGQREMV